MSSLTIGSISPPTIQIRCYSMNPATINTFMSSIKITILTLGDISVCCSRYNTLAIYGVITPRLIDSSYLQLVSSEHQFITINFRFLMQESLFLDPTGFGTQRPLIEVQLAFNFVFLS